MEDHRKLAERLLRFVRLPPFPPQILRGVFVDRLEVAGRRDNDGVEIAMDDLLDDLAAARRAGPAHRQDRGRAGTAAGKGLAVDRLRHPARRLTVRHREIEIDGIGPRVLDRTRAARPNALEGRTAHLAAEGAAARRFDNQRPEQTMAQRSCIALATSRRGQAGEEMRALAQQLPAAGDTLTGLDRIEAGAGPMDLPTVSRNGLQTGNDQGEAARQRPVGAGPRPCLCLLRKLFRRLGTLDVAEGGTDIRPHRCDGNAIARRLFFAEADAGLLRGGREGTAAAGLIRAQEIGQRDLEDVAGIGSQHQRARPLAVAQPRLAGFELALASLGTRQRSAEIGRRTLRDLRHRRHVAP